jgi:hypothetical protein
MSFRKSRTDGERNYRKIQMSTALAHIEVEGAELIRSIARREPAKVIALKTGITPRHVYNLREEIGQPQLAWPAFIAFAKQYPDLRTKVLEWLEASTGDNERDPAQVLNDIARLLQQRGP